MIKFHVEDLKKINVIFMLLSIIWMIVIFIYSSHDATKSDEISRTVVTDIITDNIPDYDEWSETKQEEFSDTMDYIVRKTAHFSEYLLLCVLYYMAFNGVVFKKRRVSYIIFVIVLCAIYASTDEIHQLYVPGRMGTVRDVLIDTSGGAVGTFLCTLVNRKIKRDIA